MELIKGIFSCRWTMYTSFVRRQARIYTDTQSLTHSRKHPIQSFVHRQIRIRTNTHNHSLILINILFRVNAYTQIHSQSLTLINIVFRVLYIDKYIYTQIHRVTHSLINILFRVLYLDKHTYAQIHTLTHSHKHPIQSFICRKTHICTNTITHSF